MRLFLPRCLLLLFSIGLLLGCTPSTDLGQSAWIQSREWRMDKTGQDTLQDAQQASDWQAMPEWKAWGFGPETVWVRLQLKAAEPHERSPWVVRVRPSVLDYVTLYDPASGLVLRTGDALPPDSDGLASINFTLNIPALPQARVVYLQVRSTSARTLHVEVMPYGQAQQKNRLQEWVVGFVLAASAIFAVWAWVQWAITREKVIFAFAVKQLVASAWAFFFLGFARVVIGPDLSEGVLTTMASTIFVWTVGVTFWFFYVLIQEYQPWRPVLQVYRLVIVLMLLLPALQWFVPTHWMLAVANVSVLVCFALLLFSLSSTLGQRRPVAIAAPVLLAYFLLYSTITTLPLLMHLAWIEVRPLVLYGTMTHAVIDGLVMFVMLQIRARTLRQEQMQAALNLQRSQQQAEDAQRHRQEQSQLFAMLAHEMKTPLATLRMWMEAGQLKPETMERAIADMNSVIERCVHTGQLADQGLQPVAQAVDPVALSANAIASCRAPERIDWASPEATGPMHTDAQMLSIVLGNLLDNACKYSAPGSRIQLSLHSAERDGRAGWLWRLSNQSGPAGLPDAPRLFEKYYRSPRARRLSGSGLGLFLVQGLLNLMQGQIAYEAQGERAVFSVWLPAQPAAR